MTPKRRQRWERAAGWRPLPRHVTRVPALVTCVPGHSARSKWSALAVALRVTRRSRARVVWVAADRGFAAYRGVW